MPRPVCCKKTNWASKEAESSHSSEIPENSSSMDPNVKAVVISTSLSHTVRCGAALSSERACFHFVKLYHLACNTLSGTLLSSE